MTISNSENVTPVNGKELLAATILPSRHLTALAKQHILSAEASQEFDAVAQADKFAKSQAVSPDQQIVLHSSIDSKSLLAKSGRYWSCVLSFHQAVIELEGIGMLKGVGQIDIQEISQGWTTVIPGSGGTSASWQFPEFKYIAQRRILRADWLLKETNLVLSDPDIYRIQAGIDNASDEVTTAARDAIECHRLGLYRPAVTMLGKVAEGAWVEVGMALSEILGGSDKTKYQDQLTSPNVSVPKKIALVVTLFRDTRLDSVQKASGVRPVELDSVLVWTDVVRDARNTIHFGLTSIAASHYENVSVLLLDGIEQTKKLYSVVNAANAYHGAKQSS